MILIKILYFQKFLNAALNQCCDCCRIEEPVPYAVSQFISICKVENSYQASVHIWYK